jgi:hypothetical protein
MRQSGHAIAQSGSSRFETPRQAASPREKSYETVQAGFQPGRCGEYFGRSRAYFSLQLLKQPTETTETTSGSESAVKTKTYIQSDRSRFSLALGEATEARRRVSAMRGRVPPRQKGPPAALQTSSFKVEGR